jgi:hypothetical protein
MGGIQSTRDFENAPQCVSSMINNYFNRVRTSNGFCFLQKMDGEKQINISIGMLRGDPQESRLRGR